MFFANNIYRERVHIDNAETGQDYFCPACKGKMIQKCGNVNAHHFAHHSNRDCDPWYAGKLSPWHSKMQSYFRPDSREVIIWNQQHTEYHIADAVLEYGNQKYVVEFQHSPLSQKTFLERSDFYIQCGYRIIWVFDFCNPKRPKTIFIADDDDETTKHLIWTRNNRVKFLDNINFSSYGNRLNIIFYIHTGAGKQVKCETDHYYPWTKWEYIDAIHKDYCFVRLYLEDFTTTSDFWARYYSEEEFYNRLRKINKDSG